MNLIKSLFKTVGLLYVGGAIATAGISCMFSSNRLMEEDWLEIFYESLCWPYVFMIIT